MRDLTAEFIRELEKDVGALREQIKYWEDLRVVGLRDINGSTKTAKEIAAGLRARMDEKRQLIESLSKRSTGPERRD